MAKQGKKSLTELAQEVEAQSKQRLDLVADTRSLQMDTSTDNNQFLSVVGEDAVIDRRINEVTPHAHGQIATKLGIPKRYYDRLLSSHPQILNANVNGLLHAEPLTRMLRLHVDENGNSRLRAFMSDKYRRIDNAELMYHAILPTLLEDDRMKDDIQVVSCEVTEKNLYLKCMSRTITELVGEQDDRVHAGFVITNSEIGLGAVSVSQYVYRQVCKNGMMGERLFNKYHVGRNVDTSFEQYMEIDTLKADDKAIMLKARDMIRAAIDKERFSEVAGKMRQTREITVENPRKAVEVLGNSFTLDQGTQDSILKRFFQNEQRDGNTVFNLVNAVTNAAEDVEDYDKATEVEYLGSRVLGLSIDHLEHIASA